MSEKKIQKRTKTRRYAQGVKAFKTGVPCKCPFDVGAYYWYLGWYDERIRTNCGRTFRKYDIGYVSEIC